MQAVALWRLKPVDLSVSVGGFKLQQLLPRGKASLVFSETTFSCSLQYRDYRTRTITANMSNSITLWSSVNSVSLLLQEMPASSEQTRSAEVFAEFFRNKIEKVRFSTVGRPPAVIRQRDTPTLCVFRTTSIDEITEIINESPAKHCSLDPASTSLDKQLGPQSAQTIANMCNASFADGVLPASQKHAIVKPRLKKPTLDLDDLNSYKPISNFRFISKTIECVVAVFV